MLLDEVGGERVSHKVGFTIEEGFGKSGTVGFDDDTDADAFERGEVLGKGVVKTEFEAVIVVISRRRRDGGNDEFAAAANLPEVALAAVVGRPFGKYSARC